MYKLSISLGVLLPGVFAALGALCLTGSEPPVPHPHFPKELTCHISKDLTVVVRYQTVTFDAAGAEKMAVGKAWHLAGAEFESSGDLVIGGRDVKAGKYALSARKADGGKWELVLHEGPRFSTRFGDDAHVLATSFTPGVERFEHLNIDVQPAGDKEHTRLFLDVRFDALKAQALIEVPEADGKKDPAKKDGDK